MDRNVLIWSREDSFSEEVKGFFKKQKYDNIFVTSEYEETKAMMSRYEEINALIIDGDQYCFENVEPLMYFLKFPCCAVVLLMNEELFEKCSDDVEKHGIFALKKQDFEKNLIEILNFSKIVSNKFLTLQKENLRLKQHLKEVKLVNRAKLVLIEYLSMSEATAHRYIEKQAMDMRISKTQVAEQILKTYEN